MNGISDDLRSCLSIALANENLLDFTFDLVGSSESGDGFTGDVFFINLEGRTKQGLKHYNLVAKCGKRSQTLRDETPIKEAYDNEIYAYKELLPLLQKWQSQKGVKDVFDSYPKCYGTYSSKSWEVVLLQNLKVLGYELWDKRKPMNLDVVNFIVKQYGQFHAISATIKDQNPQLFDELTSKFIDVWKSFALKNNLIEMFQGEVGKSLKLLDGHIATEIFEKWKQFYDQLPEFLRTKGLADCFTLILHGDCWNNNFMILFEDSTELKPKKVAMLDWQVVKVGSPILDLSYFIFTCTSGQDLPKIPHLLKLYYDSFLHHGKMLGTDLANTYSFDQLLQDWTNFAGFGINMSVLISKICLTDKDDIMDVARAADQGINFTDAITNNEPRDLGPYRNRLKTIVEYAFQNGLI